MKLTHRLLVFAALGPATSFAVMTLEVALVALVMAATGLGPPAPHVWASAGMVAHNVMSPAFLIIFALFGAPAALSGLAVDMAERHERTDPAIAIAAACAAVVLMSILPGFFTVLIYASPVGGVVAGLIAGAAAALVCWLVVPGEASSGSNPLPAPLVDRRGLAGGFGRR